MKNHSLNITWGKAFGEAYCHHASFIIPYNEVSLFTPKIVRVGVTIRCNMIKKQKVVNYIDKRIWNCLPCLIKDGAIEVLLNSSQILEALSLNSWTSLKDNVRGTQKEFPINIFYNLEDTGEIILPFDYDHAGTPYMIMEPKLVDMADGDKIDSAISFNSNFPV